MKKILFLIIFLLVLPVHSQWVQLATGSTESLNDVFCVTENTVIAIGDAGTILKTINGGNTWVQKTSGTSYNLHKVQFSSLNIGYAITKFTSDSVLLKTIDGGETWTTINFGVASVIIDISCVGENTIYLTYRDQNSNNVFKKSINGGLTFNVINSNIDVENIQFINQQIGFSGIQNNPGTGGNLYKTIDGGISWNIIHDNVTSFYFINENIGFVYSFTGMNKTINGGVAFSNLGTCNIGLFKIIAPTENVVWGTPVECPLNGSPCYGIRGELLNNGTFQIDTCQTFRSFYFSSPTIGYAIGLGGYGIFKNITGNLGVSAVKSTQVIKIYPNPASEQINISLNEKLNETFSIEITDFLGKQLFSQSYYDVTEISLDSKKFSKGVYLVTISNQDKKETQKVVVK